MSTRADSLDLPTDPLSGKERGPDRVFYELGIMLDKEDFRAEQTYHRDRLARALAFLHGSGTVAGLEVSIPPPEPGQPSPDPDNEEIRVAPGLAIDRIGRLVEVPSRRTSNAGFCLRLKKWLDFQDANRDVDQAGLLRSDRLRKSFHPEDPDADPAPGEKVPGKLIVDVFLRFAACDREKTPAFATGPFDALDAVQPGRIRDAFELQLAPRGEANPAVPESYWAPLGSVPKAQRQARFRQLVFGAWDRFRPRDSNDPFANDPVVPDYFDPRNDKHWIFLARLLIPCTDGGHQPGGTSDDYKSPTRDTTKPVVVQNEQRAFVYSTAALAQLWR
jgi:hypothetical protein